MKRLTLALPIFFVFVSFTAFGQSKDRVEKLINEFEILIESKNWQLAKQKIDRFYSNYPFEPSELDKVEKYEVDRFNRTVTEAIYGEDRMYAEIKRNNSESQCETYLLKYPYGQYRSEVQRILNEATEGKAWNTAKYYNSISSYNEYLRKYPNGSHKTDAVNAKIKLDEDAYKTAQSNNTSSSYQSYLYTFPYGKFAAEARIKLAEKKDEELYKAAKASNQLTDFEKYINTYPNGNYASEANNTIMISYIHYGDKQFDDNNWYSAKGYFEKYVSRYPNGPKASYAREKIEKCNRKINSGSRPDRWYFSYHFDDSLGFFGFSTGTINQRSLGFYTSMRMNFGHKQVIYDYYPTTNFVEGIWDNDDITLNGDFVTGTFFSSVGFTYGVFNPVWIYGGVGMSITNYYVGIDKWYSDGSLYESDWARVKEIPAYAPHVEAGLQMDLWGLNLRYGISYSNTYGLRNTFGIGISGIRY